MNKENFEMIQGLVAGILSAFGYGIAFFAALDLAGIMAVYDNTMEENYLLLIGGIIIGSFGILLYFKKSKELKEEENNA